MIYKATGFTTVALRTMLTIESTADIRPRLRSYTASNVGAITLDSNWQMSARHFTASGTTSALILAKTDITDPNALFSAGADATVEPTYVGNNWEDVGINPRGIHRWVSVDPSDDIILPAVLDSGIGFILDVLGGAITPQVIATILQ